MTLAWTWTCGMIPLLTGVELGADGRPVFNRSVVAGVAVDDYEDLAQLAAFLRYSRRVIAGGVMTTHLRTVYTTEHELRQSLHAAHC
jgi:hypothetical protein